MTTCFKSILLLTLTAFAGIVSAEPIFNIQFTPDSASFPTQIDLFGTPTEYKAIITNNSEVDIPGMQYFLPSYFTKINSTSNCGETLPGNSNCAISFVFRPTQAGKFSEYFQVCGANGVWCSTTANPLDVAVTQNYITSTNCSQIVSRPFDELTCNSSWQIAENFRLFLTKVLGVDAIHNEFYYYQHKPGPNETTTSCVDARQENVDLDPNITGGGESLCKLVGYAASSASPTNLPADSTLAKLFPPYLDFLLGTPHPIEAGTVPLSSLSSLLKDFNTAAMDSMVRNVGFTGFENFLNEYFQLQMSKSYSNCDISTTCPAISYLPYKLTNGESILQTWPLNGINFWGISGGGGSGAGYQVQAFKPGTTNHYTLYSGGGGGGGGNTTTELTNLLRYLINTGSGGGGGSQFADCYFNNGQRLNGLGLGAGTGSGISTLMGTNVAYLAPPAVEYSFYAPTAFPNWDNATVLSQYGSNLTHLFATQIPDLYNQGYSIVISGGGGGGGGVEFIKPNGEEFIPHVVSIGSGFNYCVVFNKDNNFQATDCIPSPTINSGSITVNDIIYQNIGRLFDRGMQIAILPQNCNGYQNSICTCNFVNAYVIAELGKILALSGFSTTDIPSWLNNPHCNHNQSGLMLQANSIGKKAVNTIKKFYDAKASSECNPPWV